jgi:hypothetical protein
MAKYLHRNNHLLDGTSDKIPLPCLMLSAEGDISLPPVLAEGMEEYNSDLEKHPLEQPRVRKSPIFPR